MKHTTSRVSPPLTSGYALRWLHKQEEERLTGWKSKEEREAQKIAKRAIQRDTEPQYRIADLTEGEEQRLYKLGITYGFIPNSSTTDVYWWKHGMVLRYSECLI